MGRKRKYINKKEFKHLKNKCQICLESNISVLDNHRITAGKDGGLYTKHNVVCLCSNCHRKVHTNEIVIIGVFRSTHGDVVQYEMNGEIFIV